MDKSKLRPATPMKWKNKSPTQEVSLGFRTFVVSKTSDPEAPFVLFRSGRVLGRYGTLEEAKAKAEEKS